MAAEPEFIVDNPDLKWALKALRARLDGYNLYEKYYEGEHRLTFATEKFESAFGRTFQELADNLCPKVVDVIADRLRITGFTFTPKQEGDPKKDPLEKQAWELWSTENRMARWAGLVHTTAFKLGDCYVIVWPDRNNLRMPRFFVNDATRVIVRYSEEVPGTIDFAVKWWVLTDGKIRVNMYYADRIIRLYTPSKPSKPGLPEDISTLALWDQDPIGDPPILANPFGVVPVFHFANGVGPGRMGRSELKDVVPLQDALNKSVADMLVAMEFVGLPQRWATGVESEIDPVTGKDKAKSFDVAVNRLLTVEDPNSKFGEFAAADLRQFLDVQEKFRIEIARVSSTPIHHINQATSDAPSGESLKTAEAPLTSKQDDREESFGEVWGDIMAFAMRIANGAPSMGSWAPTWKNTKPRSDLDFWTVQGLKKEIGVAVRKLLLEGGYSTTEVDEWLGEQQASQADLGSALLGAFESGQLARPVVPSNTQPLGVPTRRLIPNA